MGNDDLVALAKTDRSAFSRLYDLYLPQVTRYCMRRLFDRTLAEDVVSDVFLNVASNFRTFPGQTETDFRRWLFRIATNAVHAHLRQSRRRRELLEAAARSRHWEQASPPEWEILDWPEVYQALLDLDERDQTILSLRFFAGCSHEEIADVVQSTPGAVRTALCRTLADLRQRFNPSAPSAKALDASTKDKTYG